MCRHGLMFSECGDCQRREHFEHGDAYVQEKLASEYAQAFNEYVAIATGEQSDHEATEIQVRRIL